MAAKEPIDSDIEIEAAPAGKDAGELLSDVAETIAAKAILAAKSGSKTNFIDGQKVEPAQASSAAKKPQPKTPAKAASKGPHDSISDGDEEREGFSDAYDQTFGAGAFTFKEGKDGFDMDNVGRFTSTPSSAYANTVSYDSPSGAKSEALQQTEAWFGIAEAEMGGDGNPYTNDLAFEYDAHDFGNPYSNRYDLVEDRDFLSQIRYEEDYIDTGLGCSRYGGAFDEATRPLVENLNAWKTDSALVQRAQGATVDEETGMVYVDGKYLDPKTDPEAQKIVAAKIGMATEPELAAPMAFKPKAELDAMAAADPFFKKPEILAQREAGALPPTALAAKKDPLAISGIGQGGDIGYAYQSLDEITASALKTSTPKTTAAAPAPADPLADLEMQKPKPMAVAAPAPATPAPVPG